MYVLDEPSIGLHQRDNTRLLDMLKRLRDIGNSVIVVEHDHDAIMQRRSCGRHGPGRRRAWRPRHRRGHPGRHHGAQRIADRPVSVGPQAHRRAGAAPPHQPAAAAGDQRRTRQQPERRHGRHTRRTVHLRHRRLGVGQVHAGQRHAVPGGGARPLRQQRRARALHGHRGHRVLRQGRQCRPESDRAHAALESGDLHRAVHADPRTVRRRARSARTRLRRRTFLIQRQRRPLRSLPGRRRAESRDALPARRLCALRHLPWQALQPRDAGYPLQGPDDPRSAGDDRRAGASSSSAQCRPSRASCRR